MKSFSQLLNDLDYGASMDRYSEQLAELIEAVHKTEKKGSIILQIDIDPKNANQVEITDKLTVKLPKPDSHVTIMYVSQGNRLSRRDPRQPDLPGMRPVETEGEEGESAVG